MLDVNVPDYLAREYEQEAREDEFDRRHPICPECGGRMFSQEEVYDLTRHFVDRWYECEDCGYCQSV